LVRAVQLRLDPTTELILRADREFAAGEAELEQGRLVAARARFDGAVDLLLQQPAGARANARLGQAFDQLLDRISALELLSLREGDGFTETRTEPAAIDELLGGATFERPKPALTTRETVLEALERTEHDLEIPANEKVLSFVELFQGRLHDFLTAGLERGSRYLPMIQRVFKEEGLPVDLSYIPLVESAFKTNALSRASARGMWQFMAPTGREHGLDQTWFIDERSDPEKATRAAAQYLKSLNKFFDGDWNLALASYNAGPGRLQRAVRQSKTADYWRITESTRYLPRETRDYVPMIMAAILIARNPDLYGFEITSVGPMAFESVSVPGALDLRLIAEWANVSVEDLRELNPELRRTTTPDRTHELKVPVGTAATIQTKLTSADALFLRFQFYTVKKGETLASIARKNHVTQVALREANDLGRTGRVRANQELRIPERPTSGLPSSSATRTASVASARPSAAGSATTYRVQRGDTLSSIARQFSISIDDIRRFNQLRTDRINIGDRLTVRR
jgi:membrane-bound lytic murein transglycosylase D